MGRLLYWVLLVGSFNLAYEYSSNRRVLGGTEYKYSSYVSLKERVVKPLTRFEFGNVNWKLYLHNLEKDINDIKERNSRKPTNNNYN